MSYFGVESLALNAGQLASLTTALRALGDNSHPNPMHRCHWRIRTDGQAAIYHGSWQAEDWSITALKQRLAAIFGVAWTTIGHNIVTLSFSPGGTTTVITFTRTAMTYLRLAIFGGVGASRERGHAEALGYLKANAEAWGEGSQ